MYASLPSRECGLKFVKIHCDNFHVRVTPFAGVWIEIGWHSRVDVAARVTPFAGVWIEIKFADFIARYRSSHSLRGSVD